MSEEEPSPEEIKRMIDNARSEAEKKRLEQASKVGELKTSDKEREEIEKVLEKKLAS